MPAWLNNREYPLTRQPLNPVCLIPSCVQSNTAGSLGCLDLTAKERNRLASSMKLSPEDMAELKALSRRKKQRGAQRKVRQLNLWIGASPGLDYVCVLCVCGRARGVSHVLSLVVRQDSVVHAVITGRVDSRFLFLLVCSRARVCVCVCVCVCVWLRVLGFE